MLSAVLRYIELITNIYTDRGHSAHGMERSEPGIKKYHSKTGNYLSLKDDNSNPLLSFIQLNCCGWEGLKDFAGNSEPIDDSCYEKVTPSVSGIVAR